MNIKVVNKSLGYILPLTFKHGNGIIHEYYSNNKFPQNLFLNSFLKYDKSIHSNCIYLTYSNIENNPMYKVFEKKCLLNHDNFIIHDKYEKFNIYGLRIHNEFLDDYKLILQGKYSKISSNAKIQIIRFTQSDKTDKIYQVLFKDPLLKKEIEDKIGCILEKDAELSSIINMDDETLVTQDNCKEDVGYC
jgi:hypothetical protein